MAPLLILTLFALYAAFAVAIIAVWLIVVVRQRKYYSATRHVDTALAMYSRNREGLTAKVFGAWRGAFTSDEQFNRQFKELFSTETVEAQQTKAIKESYERLRAAYKVYFRVLGVFLGVVAITVLYGVIVFG